MTVLNPEKLVNHISGWIKGQVLAAGAKTAVVGLSGGADSALVAILCKRVFPDTVAVRMPCQSSQSSLDRAEELAKKFDIKMITVNLAPSYNTIAYQVCDGLNIGKRLEDGSIQVEEDKASGGALRSCLRAPTLDYVAKLVNGLIVGTGNRDEDEVTRYFQKRGDGAVDISPIAKLHKSEVYELLKFLECPQSIIDAVPSADLWGPDSGQEDEKELGLTYQEIEWAIRLIDKNCGLYQSGGFEIHSEYLAKLTPRQLEVLGKIAKMERVSRHKAEMPPVLDVRDGVMIDDSPTQLVD